MACCPPKPQVTPAAPKVHIIHAPVVWVDDSVRAKLKREWDDHNPNQTERAYCGVVVEREYSPGTPEYTLVAVIPSHSIRSDPSHVLYSCPIDIPLPLIKTTLHFTDLHTHPPTTCAPGGKDCKMGGQESWECYPSDTDYAHLLFHHYKVAFIQCSAEGITPFFETPYWIE
jgi:hypothetical protein